MMFDITIYKSSNAAEFKKTCNALEEYYSDCSKDKLLTDVDGSQIQSYNINGNRIVVYNDYDVDAVYVKSEIDLSDVFNSND